MKSSSIFHVSKYLDPNSSPFNFTPYLLHLTHAPRIKSPIIKSNYCDLFNPRPIPIKSIRCFSRDPTISMVSLGPFQPAITVSKITRKNPRNRLVQVSRLTRAFLRAISAIEPRDYRSYRVERPWLWYHSSARTGEKRSNRWKPGSTTRENDRGFNATAKRSPPGTPFDHSPQKLIDISANRSRASPESLLASGLSVDTNESYKGHTYDDLSVSDCYPFRWTTVGSMLLRLGTMGADIVDLYYLCDILKKVRLEDRE